MSEKAIARKSHLLKSMTGFGYAEAAISLGKIKISLKSVNRKGCDLNLYLPSCLDKLEPLLREKLSQVVSRGAVTLNVELNSSDLAMQTSRSVFDLIERIEKESSWSKDQVIALLGPLLASKNGYRESLSLNQKDEKLIMNVVQEAIASFEAFRVEEGKSLQSSLKQLLDQLERECGSLKPLLEDLSVRVKERFSSRLQQVGFQKEVDVQRWHMEVALLLEKIDVHEEIERFIAHCVHFKKLLQQGPFPVGRKLDFLTQELIREINTLMSKAQDSKVAVCGLEIKALIERLREQLQNVE